MLNATSNHPLFPFYLVPRCRFFCAELTKRIDVSGANWACITYGAFAVDEQHGANGNKVPTLPTPEAYRLQHHRAYTGCVCVGACTCYLPSIFTFVPSTLVRADASAPALPASTSVALVRTDARASTFLASTKSTLMWASFAPRQ
jgi:hypothetical protein